MQSLAQTSVRFYPVLRRIRFSTEIQSNRGKSLLSSLRESIPAKPRRPGNPFIQFLKDVQPKIIAENPDCSRTGMVKIASEMWRNADKTIKDQYETIFKELNAKYEKTLQSYHNNLTDVQKVAMEQVREADLKRRKMSKIKKTLDELGKPKRPPSAYGIFLTEIDCKTKPDETNQDRLKRLSKAWQTLSEAEREQYFLKAAEARENYLIRLEEWESKILSTINIDPGSNEGGAKAQNESKTASKSKKATMSDYITSLFEKHKKK